MTTAEAITIARHEITMHRQGDGWCVSYSYNGIRWTGDEVSYAEAREQVRQLRIERALDLLGCDDDYVVHYALESSGCFEAAVREAIRQ